LVPRLYRTASFGDHGSLLCFHEEVAGPVFVHFANRDVAFFAKDKQTPFFLFSETHIQENYSRFRAEFSGDRIPLIYYSVKTNYESAVLLTMRKLGAGAEVAGHLDLYLAEKAGFDPDRIVLDGMVKEPGLLELAIGKGIKTINIDTMSELGQISEIAERL
jgi:diaminopimelate decarboxylase